MYAIHHADILMTHEELMKRDPQWLPDGRVRARGVTIYQQHKCDFCGKDCWVVSSDLSRKGVGFCNFTCMQGWRSQVAREGRRENGYGYVLIRRPEHPSANANGYILEHRLVMSEHLGRPLEANEVVHHRNGNVKDNRIENLELLGGRSEHNTLHGNLGDLATLVRYGVRNCTKCGQVKPLEEFARSRAQLHGRVSWCKSCRHDHYIATNPQRKRATEAASERHRARWEGTDDYTLVQAGRRRCKTCGEVKALDDFSRHPHCMAGRIYYCKVCDGQRRKAAGYKPH